MNLAAIIVPIIDAADGLSPGPHLVRKTDSIAEKNPKSSQRMWKVTLVHVKISEDVTDVALVIENFTREQLPFYGRLFEPM